MITFKDIMTRGIIFYDEEYVEECKEFCRVRHINFLPHIHDKNVCYHYDSVNTNFVKRSVSKDQVVWANEQIFNKHFVQNFKTYDVLFVEEDQEIKGVVHFSDYNRSPVYEIVYRKLFQLERGLVHLIVEHAGMTQNDLAQFSGNPIREGEYVPLREKDFRGNQISLRLILQFTHKHNLVKIREKDIYNIIAVRNKIAHSDNLVSKTRDNTNKYRIRSFEELMRGIDSLKVAIRQVSNRIYFMQATTDENFASAAVPLEEFLFK